MKFGLLAMPEHPPIENLARRNRLTAVALGEA
jgi:hypothetical protein